MFGNTMKYYVLLTALSMFASSCGKTSHTSYPYLNEKMNEEKAVTTAELQALKYENAANGNSGSYGIVITSAGPIFEEKVSVTLGKDRVHLQIYIEINPWNSNDWIKSSTEAGRVNACKQVCFANIRALANFLSCDPKLIDVNWVCLGGHVQGKTSGEEALSTKEAEQPGAAQPATQPADKAPAKDQPLTPTSKDAPR